MHHGRNTQPERRGENQISIFRKRIHAMPNGMEFDGNELQIFYAALNFALVDVVVAMRTKTRQPEEPARVFSAQFCDLVMPMLVIFRPGIGLNNGRIHAAFILASKHLFYSAEQAENAALS